MLRIFRFIHSFRQKECIKGIHQLSAYFYGSIVTYTVLGVQQSDSVFYMFSIISLLQDIKCSSLCYM